MKKESDTPNPLGFYGKSKLAGDAALSNLASFYSIVRTNTPFGLHKTKKSFPLWVKENFESKKDTCTCRSVYIFCMCIQSIKNANLGYN